MEKIKPVSLNADYFKKLIEDANVIIFRMALPSGKFEYVSPACKEITGYEPQEFYDNPLLIKKFIHPGWQAILEHRIKDILKGEIKPFYEYRIIHKSGKEKWIHQKNIVEYGSDGSPVAVESVITDVSELKNIQAELAASENKFRLAFNNTPNILAISSLFEGGFIEINDNFEKVLGWKREDINGRSAFELGLVRDNSKREELIEIIRRDGRISNHEIEMFTKSGDTRTGEIFGEVIDVNDKKLLILQVNDITERKKAEKALEDSREHYRQLIHNFPDGIIIHRDGEILYGNPAVLKLFGLSNPEDYAGRTMLDFVPEESRGLILERRKQFRQGKTPPQVEMKCLDINGKKIDVAITVSHVYFKGERAVMTIFYDITDRKKIEEALYQREQQYRLISDNMRDSVWLMDMNFKTIWISPSVVETRGFTLEELQAMPLEKHLTPESFDTAVKTLSEELTPGNLADKDCEISKIVELEFICKDGTTFWGEINMTLLRDPEGKPSGFLGVGRDITERRKAEQALKISEEKYRNIFDNAILGIYRSTPEGTYEEMNQAFADIVGYGSPKEMMAAITDIQKQLYVNPEDRTKIGQMLASTGYVKGYEAELYHLDGHHVWISINSKAVKDEAGNILYYEGTVENITERKKTAEELRKSEERFRDIFENAVEGIFQTTLDGRFITVNPALARMHNCESPEDLIKKTGNIGEIYCDPKDREEVLRLLSENDVIEGYVNRFRRVSDGSIKWGSLNLRLVRDEDGNPQYIEGTCTDITEQKSAEEERMKMDEQLRQAQKLESIGVLAGGIAHDFNNMLMVIIGNTELALMDIPEKSPVVPRLNNINMVAMSAANLCKQMLAYSGKGFFQMAPLNLTGMINEMEQMLKTSISKKAKLDLHLDDEMPLIKADMSQIQQIIMNLVINASEAIGEKPGTITIKTGQKQCSAEYLKTFHLSDEIVEGLYVCMEISDTGCGMEKETLGKIFDPFFTTKFTGRGLGLAAVLGIVRSHKGAIRINSEPGKGSTFKILFPAIEFSPVKKEAEIKQGKDWHGSGTILLVDDDDQIRNVCKRILERIGFEVITAEDGKDGIDVFSKNRDKIRCVILDLTMPRMDGKEAYSELMLIDPDVKVIISSGYNEIEVMNSFKGKGLAGFIQKPYQLENMKDELKKVLG